MVNSALCAQREQVADHYVKLLTDREFRGLCKEMNIVYNSLEKIREAAKERMMDGATH